MAQLPQWKMQLLHNVVAASGREEDEVVTRWLLRVERDGMTFDRLKQSGDGFRTLDQKLAAALSKIFSGELARKLSIAERRNLRENERLLTGRQKLFSMYEHFRTNDSMSYAHDITDLTAVAWCGDGDDQIERFRNNWDGTIAGMVEEPNEKLLTEILLEQMVKSSALKEEIMAYRRLKKDDPSKSYQGHLDIMERHLVLAQTVRPSFGPTLSATPRPLRRQGSAASS